MDTDSVSSVRRHSRPDGKTRLAGFSSTNFQFSISSMAFEESVNRPNSGLEVLEARTVRTTRLCLL